jgi:hypothetical protein
LPPFGSTTALPSYSYLLIRFQEAGSDQAWMFTAPPRWSPIDQIHPVEHFGSPRFLGSPLVPLPRSPTPAAPPAPCHLGAEVSPPQVRPRRPQHSCNFRGSITRLRYSLSTLPASAFPTLARLASGGWQTLTGWDSNPLGSFSEFQVWHSLPYLFQRSRLGLAPFTAYCPLLTILIFPPMSLIASLFCQWQLYWNCIYNRWYL